jgi:hypothetical protein
VRHSSCMKSQLMAGAVSIWCFTGELLGFWTLSINRFSKKLENTPFQKLDLFPSSGEGGGDTYNVGSLRKS